MRHSNGSEGSGQPLQRICQRKQSPAEKLVALRSRLVTEDWLNLTSVCEAKIRTVKSTTSRMKRGAFCSVQKSHPTVNSAHFGGTMIQGATLADRGV